MQIFTFRMICGHYLRDLAKFRGDRTTDSDLCVLKFWLGSPYSRPNFGGFSGVRPLKSGQLSSRPAKGTNGYEDTSYELSRVKIGSAVSAVACLMESKKSN